VAALTHRTTKYMHKDQYFSEMRGHTAIETQAEISKTPALYVLFQIQISNAEKNIRAKYAIEFSKFLYKLYPSKTLLISPDLISSSKQNTKTKINLSQFFLKYTISPTLLIKAVSGV